MRLEAVEETDEARAEDVPVDVVVDRLVVKPGATDRFASSVDQGLGIGAGVLRALVEPPGGETEEVAFADRPHCARCGVTWPPLSTALFAFDRPAGACPACEGRGRIEHVETPRGRRGRKGRGRSPRRRRLERCPACEGRRLGPFPRAARLRDRTLPDLEEETVASLRTWLQALDLAGEAGRRAAPARNDAVRRLRFLESLGLGYLAPARAAATLSGGELRRAQLAAACAARMSGLLYLIDEPVMGLHPSERERLMHRLRALVDEGSTVIVTGHDPVTLLAADHVVELGPGAGRGGGEVVAEGPAEAVLAQG
ncbi:MAG: AAA family ATPase, partial [Planctomycetota bacterium]